MKTLLHSFKGFAREQFPSMVGMYRSARKCLRKKTDSEAVEDLYKRLNRRVPDVFFVEIGAMDGVSYDILYRFVADYKWRGLLVEPLPDMFEQLKHNYVGREGLIFENVAISDVPGEKTLFRVRPEAVEAGLVPPWAKGISSLYLDRNALAGKGITQGDYERIQPHIVGQTVDCESLRRLLDRHKIKKIDVLQIDVEGYDYQVLKQVDFDLYRPYVISVEWCNLSEEEKKLTISLLRKRGYRLRFLSVDLLAWRQF